jgi:hypothetical protein
MKRPNLNILFFLLFFPILVSAQRKSPENRKSTNTELESIKRKLAESSQPSKETMAAREYTVFGKPSKKDFELNVYEKDTTANAVILFESAQVAFVVIKNELYLQKRIYQKIKILKESAKANTDGVIFLIQQDEKNYEWVNNVKGIIHNGEAKVYISENDSYTSHLSGNLFRKNYVFPDVQVGSIIEFQYDLYSPFFFNLEGWNFQNNIPTLYSEFSATIPLSFSYNQVFFGKKPLLIKDAWFGGECPRIGKYPSCQQYLFAMRDIPAFIEEDFMLSVKNYISRIGFELKQYNNFDGKKKYYTTSWKNVEKEFKKDKNIGGQLKNTGFFKSQLPKEILSIENDLERAKAVYAHIQNHFSNNNKGNIFTAKDIKKAYVENLGNPTEINLALVNALNAAKLNAYIAFSSTRDNGIPTKHHAVITDFNYMMVFLKIGEEKYFLDASDKFMDFGMVPYQALNYDARIMDFKKGSYWEIIYPYSNNTHSVTAQLKINPNNDIEGQVREINTGYYAAEIRSTFHEVLKENYIRHKESAIIESEISSYQVTGQDSNDVPFIENYQLLIYTNDKEQIFFDPFLLAKIFLTNPFKLENRVYPIDFGYSRRHSYTLVLDLVDKFTVEKMPESVNLKLFDSNAEIAVNYSFSEGVLQMRFDFQLHKIYYAPEAYPEIKEFFGHLVHIQNNNPVILKRL